MATTKSEQETINLLWLYHFFNPTISAKQIYAFWGKSNLFKEFDKPPLEKLSAWMEEFKE